MGEVFQADAKALGKVAANAGIAVAKVNDWIAYGMSGGTISPPDYKDAYYKPENNVEKLMMRQGTDALGWAIPGPGVGRAAVAEKDILRAVEPASDIAAQRAEVLGAILAPTGQFYSVIHEMRLDPTLYPGSSRPVHVQAANESLLQTMEEEIAFAQDLLNQGLNLQRTPKGLAPRAAPSGFSWHHADEPSVMQLVPRSQHDQGSIFQKTLHPNGRGGFSLWGKK